MALNKKEQTHLSRVSDKTTLIYDERHNRGWQKETRELTIYELGMRSRYSEEQSGEIY